MRTITVKTNVLESLTILLMSPLELLFKGKKYSDTISIKTEMFMTYCGNDSNVLIILNTWRLNRRSGKIMIDLMRVLDVYGKNPLIDEKQFKELCRSIYVH